VITSLLAVAAVLLGRGAPPLAPASPAAGMAARAFPSAADAVTALLADPGGVVAFGEVHQRNETAGTRSALARFKEEILPVIAPRTAHLVVETWMTRGTCGQAEARVTDDVARTTERPAETESEIGALLRRAKELGIAPHILEITCDEYRSLTGADGKVDYDRLLTITTHHLEVAARQALELPRSPQRPLVVFYGGALHNDLYPAPATARYSFGPAVYALARGAYREIDLYVPELADQAPAMRADPWYAAWLRRAGRGKKPDGAVAVIARGPRSAILVFPRSAQR
jgi:hypothetical protein